MSRFTNIVPTLALMLLVFIPVTSFKTESLYEMGIRKVVIDAGHGGKDSGCRGSMTKEKDICLAIALKLGKFIEDNFQNVEVIYTRKKGCVY